MLSSSNGTFTGIHPLPNCTLTATDGGCGVADGDNSSYGVGFNAAGGGVWILYLEESVKIWLFHRQSIPADITAGSPDPSQWGEPVLDFESEKGCDVAANFIKQMIVRRSLFFPFLSFMLFLFFFLLYTPFTREGKDG